MKKNKLNIEDIKKVMDVTIVNGEVVVFVFKTPASSKVMQNYATLLKYSKGDFKKAYILNNIEVWDENIMNKLGWYKTNKEADKEE